MRLKSQVLEFGPFRLEPSNHLLTREGTPIQLAPKAFGVLVYLVQSNGKLVTTDELMKAVWPDSFVEEDNVSVYISQIRKALGSAEGGHFIETVPRRGYRFKAEVRIVEEDEDEPRVPPPAPLVLLPPKPPPAIAHAEKESFPAASGSAAEGLAEVRGNHVVVHPLRPEFLPGSPCNQQETAEPAQPAQSVQPLSTIIGWRVAAVVVCVAMFAALGWLVIRRGIRPAAPIQQIRLTSFAPEMAVTAAAMSTGSKFIAYSNPAGLFLLDTNTLIYFFRGQWKVAERLFATSPADIAISSVHCMRSR